MDDSTTHLILWGAAAYVAYELYQSYAGNAAPTVQSSATGQVSVTPTGTAPGSSDGAGVMHMGNPGMISAGDLGWRTGAANGSGFAPLNIQPQYGSLATPTSVATPRPAAAWGMPGWNAPDPSIYRTSPEQAAQQSAAIDATMHAASVAEAPYNKITMDQHCTSLWGNPIPGCK